VATLPVPSALRSPGPAAGRPPALRLGAAAALAVAAAGLGLLAGTAPELLVSLTLVLAAAVAIWQFPLLALVALVTLRVAMPDVELPNLVLAAGGALALLLARARTPPRTVLVPFAAFLALAALTVPLTATPSLLITDDWLRLPGVDLAYFPRGLAEVRELVRVASLLVVLWLAYATVRSAHHLRVLVAAVLVAGAGAVAVGLWQWANGITFYRDGFEGIAGPFAHPSVFAYHLLIVLGVGIVTLLRRRPGLAWAAVAAVVVGALACLFLTYSRAAWVGLGVVVLVVALLEDRRILVVLALLVPLALVAAPRTATLAEDRVADVSGSTSSWSWRIEHWEQMLPVGLERPLLGHGFGTYHDLTVAEYGARTVEGGGGSRVVHDEGAGDRAAPAASGPEERLGINAHNDFLKAFVELGIAGLLLWTAVLAGLAVALARARAVPAVRPYATAMLGVLVALAIVSATDNLRDYTVTSMTAFALAGAVLGARAAGLDGSPVERAARRP
jgi:O-antigen ligase